MLRLRLLLLLLLFAPGATAQQLGGHTHLLHDSAHGTQVEYLAPGGQTFLWYPGNTVILAGRWKREGEQMCFAYGANTYNPATGHSGGGWECMPFYIYWGGIWERMSGDIFALARRTAVPFQLPKERTTLQRLLSRVSPGSDAPPVEYTINTPDGGHITQNCEQIIANVRRSVHDMQAAADVYFHGRYMGKPCVRADYDLAFALAEESGLDVTPWVRRLQELAGLGFPDAKSALARLGY